MDFETRNVRFEQLEPVDPIDGTLEYLDPEFTEYCHVQSQYDLRKGLARTYLLAVDGIVCYASIAMAYLRKESTEQTRTREPDENIQALDFMRNPVLSPHDVSEFGHIV